MAQLGDDRPWDTQRQICRRAFDLGVTHFDLANNYGPPYGAAESNFGRILATDFVDHRDELVISTKAALSADSITDERLARVRALNEIARRRGQTLAELALVWALRDPRMTSLVIGASSVRQLDDNIAALQNPSLTADELAEIARYGTDAGINPWQQSSDR